MVGLFLPFFLCLLHILLICKDVIFLHRKNLVLFIKSIVVGMFMLVPGISGGTLAIILNIYEGLLSSLSHLFRNFKSNFLYLLTALFGGILGIIISSYFIDFFIKNYYFELLFLFIGITMHFSYTQIKNSKLLWYKKVLSIVFISVISMLKANREAGVCTPSRI